MDFQWWHGEAKPAAPSMATPPKGRKVAPIPSKSAGQSNRKPGLGGSSSGMMIMERSEAPPANTAKAP